MKNLFRRIYIQHDNFLTVRDGQKRLVISGRTFQYPFPTAPAEMEQIGLVGYHKSLVDADDFYGSRANLWATVRAIDGRVVIIADKHAFAEILIQFWKSIFRAATFEGCWPLYELVINNENLLAMHAKTSIDSDANVAATMIEAISQDEFRTLFATVTADWTISELTTRDLPIEYLLANYFGATVPGMVARTNAGKVTFSKIKEIVLTNVISQLVDAKKDYFLSTHSYHRLNDEDGATEVVTNPLGAITNNSQLSWVLDPEFRADNVNGVIAKYGMEQLRTFFHTYARLFDFEFEEAFALDYLIADDIAGLLEYDVKDDKGNFFGTEDFVFKINGLLVSYLYRNYRLQQKAQLASYALR